MAPARRLRDESRQVPANITLSYRRAFVICPRECVFVRTAPLSHPASLAPAHAHAHARVGS
jgi:hypothetical protein